MGGKDKGFLELITASEAHVLDSKKVLVGARSRERKKRELSMLRQGHFLSPTLLECCGGAH